MTSQAPRKPIVSIELDAPLTRAIELMQEQNIRHLPVLDDGRLVGVVSERDLTDAQALEAGQAGALSVAEAMTPEPYTVAPGAPLAEVAATMAEQKLGCAVIVDGAGNVLEIFTTHDALRLLARALPDVSVDEALARSTR